MSDLNFGAPAPIVKGHALPVPISLGQRILAARGTPQAVVKVLSYGHGTKGVTGSMKYISKGGELSLETESEDPIQGTQEQAALVRTWSRDFGAHKNSRDSVHIAFSMPKGSDPEALRGAVRTVLNESFSGHEAVFAIHQDRPHPHAHVIVKMRNRKSGKQLRLNRPEIYHLREVFAEAAREEGVELAVSPRAARGVGRKGVSQAVYQLRRRGITPNVDKEAERSWARDMLERRWEEKPWEQAMAERNKREREAYQKEAEELRKTAELKSQQESQRLLKDAQLLEQFAKRMPKAKSRRQEFMEKKWQEILKLRQFEIRRQNRGEEMER